MNKEIYIISSDFYINFRVQKLRFFAFSRGPGGFRELWEAGRNNFPPILVPISRRGKELWPKTLGGDFVLPSKVCSHTLHPTAIRKTTAKQQI